MICLNKKTKLFYKFLFNYLVLLFLPIIILSTGVYLRYSKILTNEIINQNQLALQKLSQDIDKEFGEIIKSCSLISTDENLTPYAMTNSIKFKEGIDLLSKYFATRSFIYDVFYYSKNIPYILSTRSSYKKELFINYLFKYRNLSSEKFFKDMQYYRKPHILPLKNITINNIETNNFITYCIPIPYQSKNPHSTIFFLIPEKKLIGHMDKFFNQHKGFCIILNNKGEIIANSNHAKQLSKENKNQILENCVINKSITQNIEKEQYLINTYKCSTTNWTIASFIPEKIIFEKVDYIKKLTLISVLLVAIVGVLIIKHSMKKTYTPIYQLKQMSDNYYQTDKNKNEFDSVIETLNHLNEKQQSLKNTIDMHKSAYQQSLLTDLLKGSIDSLEQLNDLGKEINIKFNNAHFLIGIFHIHKKMEFELKEKITKEVLTYINIDKLQAYVKENLDVQNIVFVFSTNESSAQNLYVYFNDLHKKLINSYNIKITFGISSIYTDLKQLSTAYFEAQTALDNRLIEGNNKVILFEIVVTNKSSAMWYPKKELFELEKFIKMGDIENTYKIIQDIINKIKNQDIPLFTTRRVCFGIINLTMNIMNEYDFDYYSLEEEYSDTTKLTEFESVEEMAEIIMKILSDLVSKINDAKQVHQTDLLDKIILFIQQNYDTSQFSIGMMAENLKITPSYLSHYFKKQTGKNMKQYIDELRIEKVKQILRETDKPLNKIMSQIGYMNTSSFIRKFKSMEGMTPGTYRTMYRNKK